MREDQFDGYVREVEELREEFAGRIAVRLGLEADYAEGREEELARWLVARATGTSCSARSTGSPATGSTIRRARPARFAREGAERLYDEYYRLLARAARTGLFDVLTHFDLPKKHGHRPATPRDRAPRTRPSRPRQRVRLRRRDLLGGPAQARRPRRTRSRVCSPASSRPESRSRSPRTRTRPAEVGWGYERTLRARARVRRRPSSSPSRSGGRFATRSRVKCRPSSAKRSAEGAAPARERGVVDLEEAEARAESFEPLEVVDQRPVEVSVDPRARPRGDAPARGRARAGSRAAAGRRGWRCRSRSR